MARYYIQDNESTALIRWLDDVGDIETGLPKNDYKLNDVLMDGSQISGIGSMQGREWGCNYLFKNNDENERESFLDWFTRPSLYTVYLYKLVTRRFKCNITSGSTVITFLDSSNALNQLSTGSLIYGVGIPSTTIIDTINTTSILIDNAATVTISNAELESDTFKGRTRVYPKTNGGETYKNIRISEKLNFNLLSPSPYFMSTSLTTVTFNSTSTNEFSTNINIKSCRTPCIYEFTPNETFNLFQIKTQENYGFRVSRNFVIGEVIQVDTRNSQLVMTINGNISYSAFSSSSTPFSLERGNNTLNITASNSSATALKISYYKRQL
jgi:hypothetical protein